MSLRFSIVYDKADVDFTSTFKWVSTDKKIEDLIPFVYALTAHGDPEKESQYIYRPDFQEISLGNFITPQDEDNADDLFFLYNAVVELDLDSVSDFKEAYEYSKDSGGNIELTIGFKTKEGKELDNTGEIDWPTEAWGDLYEPCSEVPTTILEEGAEKIEFTDDSYFLHASKKDLEKLLELLKNHSSKNNQKYLEFNVEETDEDGLVVGAASTFLQFSNEQQDKICYVLQDQEGTFELETFELTAEGLNECLISLFNQQNQVKENIFNEAIQKLIVQLD